MIFSKQGLTLLELLFCLSIVVIVASLGMPSLRHINTLFAHRTAALDAEHLLNHARQKAITSNRKVVVTIQNEPWCMGANYTHSCNCQLPISCKLDGETAVIQGNEFPMIKLQELTLATPQTIQFSPLLGTAFGNNGSFKLESPLATVHVVVSTIGRTRVCLSSGNLSGLPAC